MSRHKHFAAAMAVLLVASTLAIAGVAAAEEQGLAIDVAQDDAVEIGVTNNGSAVAGANVTVATVETNDTYAGVGTYETDENGTVTLDRPGETVDVAIGASVGNATVETTATLEPVDDGPTSFGALVSAFVDDVRNDSDTGDSLGVQIANFVVENNPGNAPDHAGPPEHAGGPDGDDENDSDGGPPAHAGGSDDAESDDEADAESADERDDDDEDDEEADDGGPPSHANAGSN